MEKIFLIRNDEVYDSEPYYHKTKGFKSLDDAKRELESLKESLKDAYKGELEDGWVLQESETEFKIYRDGEDSEYCHSVFIEEIEVN